MDQSSEIIIALIEISPEYEINMLIHKEEGASIYFMNNFNFKSNKSLANFLESYKIKIINELNEELCAKLEAQDYFDYLQVPWYSIKYNGVNIITPEQLFKIVVDENIITQKHIYKYLSLESDDYKYEVKRQNLS